MENIKEQAELPRKIALYQYLGEHPWYSVMEIVYSGHDERYNPLPDGQIREVPRDSFVRVSEPQEIKFSVLADNSIIEQAVASLNESERQAIEELNKKLMSIRERKAQLLSLTHQPEVV